MNLSNITSIFSGGMTTVYKWLAIGGLILSAMVGSYFYGHHVGVQSQQVQQEKQTVKNVEKVVTITKVQTVIDTSAVDDLQKKWDAEKAKVASLQTKLSTMTNQQLQVVKQTPTGTECVLSKDWVDAYNASVRGSTP